MEGDEPPLELPAKGPGASDGPGTFQHHINRNRNMVLKFAPDGQRGGDPVVNHELPPDPLEGLPLEAQPQGAAGAASAGGASAGGAAARIRHLSLV